MNNQTHKTIGGGARPCKVDHRDYDFHKTFGNVGQTPAFPEEFMVDANLWMPDQNNAEPVFGNPPLPYGCTEYASCDVCADQDGKLYNPMYLENNLHASQNGGADVRQTLLQTTKIGTQAKDGTISYRTAVFNIQKYAPSDYFDAIRYAMISGGLEKRSVSWGTPWFREWENAALSGIGIMPAPNSWAVNGIGWHNSKFAGWKTINGITYLVNKSWQGTKVGDNGWLYFSREVVNATMAIQGTCAFTVTSMGSPTQTIQTISVSFIQWLASVMRNLIGLRY